jgi:hypothetical protein
VLKVSFPDLMGVTKAVAVSSSDRMSSVRAVVLKKLQLPAIGSEQYGFYMPRAGKGVGVWCATEENTVADYGLQHMVGWEGESGVRERVSKEYDVERGREYQRE